MDNPEYKVVSYKSLKGGPMDAVWQGSIIMELIDRSERVMLIPGPFSVGDCLQPLRAFDISLHQIPDRRWELVVYFSLRDFPENLKEFRGRFIAAMTASRMSEGGCMNIVDFGEV